MALMMLAIAWWLLPAPWHWLSLPGFMIAAASPVAVWPLLAAVTLMARRWVGALQRARAAREVRLAAPVWVALLALYAPIAGNLAAAATLASARWQQRYPHLASALGHPGLVDLDHRCRALNDAQTYGPLVAQVAAGLDRMRDQGVDTQAWLAQLQDQHDMAQAEQIQARAAALGSKLLVPLVLGALPQAFLIIGFVTLQGEGI
ncbi:hypothetical protein GH975_07990 [Litorivicinus lipolyticus]|uniref:Uncharacterized protein n=1 Tax=Litorivicinus lipolyticus TaxID=418701 RepID=A0A5Q2QDW0_9GAMM|nr:hypothetical protein [Litorivicinus lipolyticus]QGG80512.1 hypothetical protein GH975_07990 [Litorivicinus lipolyticus]